ncbi:hypothetical protein QCN27_15770 [Cereibacter sp. SYSU M97828]|nr:hypothetical protein [Cereibacter flavus]
MMLDNLILQWSIWEAHAHIWFLRMTPEAQRTLLVFWLFMVVHLCMTTAMRLRWQWTRARYASRPAMRLSRPDGYGVPLRSRDSAFATDAPSIRKLRSMVLTDAITKRLMQHELKRGARSWPQAAEWAVERLIRDRK